MRGGFFLRLWRVVWLVGVLLVGVGRLPGLLAEVEREWLEDPLVVPVEFWGRAMAGAVFTVSLGDGQTQGLGSDCAVETITPMRTVQLKTYTKYNLRVSGSSVASVTAVEVRVRPGVDLLSAKGRGANLATFKVYVNGTEASSVEAVNPSGGCDSFDRSWEVEVRPDQGPRPVSGSDGTWSRAEENLDDEAAPGDADWPELGPGLSDQPSVASIKWSVNVGRLNSGRAAGQIRFRELGLSAASFTPGALLYAPPISNAAELEVVRSSQGWLRQIKAPQCFVDIVPLSSWSFEIRYYLASQAGSKGANGLYPDPAASGQSPFVSWRIESPDQTLTRLNVTERRGQSVHVAAFRYDAGMRTWTLGCGTASETGRIFKRAISIDSPTQRTELIEISNAAGVLAYKAVETYRRFDWGWELVLVVKNPGAAEVRTAYDFYQDPAMATEHGKLRSITHSDGSWEKREYYTVAEENPLEGKYAGALARVFRPWKDSNSNPGAATELNSKVSEYFYTPPGQGPVSVQSIVHSFKGEQTGTAAWLRSEGFGEDQWPNADGLYIREEQRWTGNSGRRGQLEIARYYPTSAQADLADQPVFEQYSDGVCKVFYYERGTYNAGLLRFDPSASGSDWRVTSVSGGDPQTWLAGQGPGATVAVFDGHQIDPIYVVPLQSLKETKILQRGRVLLRERFVVRAVDATTGQATCELLDQWIHSHDSLGHLIRLARRDPISGTERVLFTADWRMPADLRDGNLKMSEVDETGTRITYTYDNLKQRVRSTKMGVSASADSAAQVDLSVSLVFDAAGNTLSQTVEGGTLRLAQSWSYDLAGRLSRHLADDNLETLYQYSNGGRTLSVIHPGGATEVTDRFLDGRTRSITGNAVVAEFFEYGQTGKTAAPGSPEVIVVDRATTLRRQGSAGSVRWHKELFDLGEKLTGQHRPVPSGTLTNVFAYDSRAQLQHVAEPAAGELGPSSNGSRHQFQLFDPAGSLMGQPVWSGLSASPDYWVNSDADAASTTRLQKTEAGYEKIGVNWFKVTTHKTYLADLSASPTVLNIQKEQLTGLGPNVQSQITLVDVNNNQTTMTATVDPGAARVTEQVQTAQSSTPAVRITVNGLVQSESTPTVSVPTRFYYDTLGRLTRLDEPTGASQRTEYDPGNGRIIATWDKANRQTAYEYYPSTHLNAGRLWNQTLNSRKTYFEYNARGDLIRTWGDQPYPQEYVYDDLGQLIELRTFRTGTFSGSATWPGAGVAADSTRWIYDPASGLLLEKTDALGRGQRFAYHTNSLVRTRTSARGIVATYAYNNFWDLTRIDYSDGTPSVQFGNYNRSGQPRSVTDATGSRTLVYDAAGRLESDRGETGLFQGLTVRQHFDPRYGRDWLRLEGASTPLQVDFSYNPANGRLEIVTAGTLRAVYGYQSNSDRVQTVTHRDGGIDRLMTVQDWELGFRLRSISHQAGGLVVGSFSRRFDAANRCDQQTSNDGSTWGYAYNNRDELLSAARKWPDGTFVAGQLFEYRYDNAGNRTLTAAGGDSSGGALRWTSCTADALNRMASRAVSGTVDIIGRATASTPVAINGQTATRWNDYFHGTVQAANSTGPVQQSVSVSLTGSTESAAGSILVPPAQENFSYDTDGNQSADGLWTYGWDAENRLIWIESQSALPAGARKRLEFTYDYLGRRVRKLVQTWTGSAFQAAGELKFVYDGGRLLAELTPSNQLVRSYTWGLDQSGTEEGAGGAGGLLSINTYQATDPVQMVMSDGGGNICGLVSAQDGRVSARYEFGPFGELLRASGPMARAIPLGWSSKYLDSETDLVYYGQRYYSPSTGRWLSRDPIEEDGGLNLYGFVGNDPVNRIDAWGLLVDNEDEELDIRLSIAAEHSGFVASYAYGSEEQALHDQQMAKAWEDTKDLGWQVAALIPTATAGKIVGRVAGLIFSRALSFAAGLASKLAKLEKAIEAQWVAHSMRKQVRVLDFSTPPNKAVFYSGPGQGSRATAFAERIGGMTIEMTPGGRVLSSNPAFRSLDPAQQFKIWQTASTKYAENAKGKVNAFIKGARPDRTFRSIEEPILRVNPNVYQIEYHY